jgi:hypothetical protein
MVHTLSQSPGGTVTISDAQFSKLVAMLKPGFELSTLMLADYKRANPPPTVPVPDVVARPSKMKFGDDFHPSHFDTHQPALDVVAQSREMTNDHEIGSAVSVATPETVSAPAVVQPSGSPPLVTPTGFEAR